ncbi:GIP [Symbiodinium sp. CCMP2592]|nr:GIP [Symbiodinium sp. CCMP2592]
MLNLTFFDDDGSFCRIQEAFTVASVINPLMAIGKLFREGWELRVNEEEGMCLTDGSSRIPVHLHKNSLAAYAYVQTPSRSRSYSSTNYKMVRTVVQLNKHVQEAVNKEEPGWHNTDSMVIVKYATQSNYENPSLMYSPTHFPYRSTLVKEERGWRAVEVSKKYSEKADPFEEFAEGEKEVVTAISAKPIPLWILGTPYAAGDRAEQESHGRDYWKMDLEKGEVVRHHVVPRTVLFDPTGVSNCPVLLGDLENSRYTQGDCIYSTEIYEHSDDWRADRLPLREHFRLPWFGQTRFRVKPEVVEDLKAEAAAEELKKKKEEHYKEKEDSAVPPEVQESKDEEMREAQGDQEAPQEVVEVLEESFYHEGVEYTAQKSSLKELQALCREYRVKTTGSKKQLLKRLATAVREERLSTQHKEQREHHQAYHLAPPQEPTEEERAYHNLTHLPYQPWCPHCVAMKAREDNHKKGLSKPSSSTDSAKPVISFDFCYTSTTGSEEPPAVTLVAVDSWSKAVLAVPCKRKGGAGSTTHLAEALVQFTTQLGYNTLVLKADNENAAKALKDKVQKVRSSLGLSTTLQESIPYDHESNGAAERAIQTVRRQANTILDELRERTQLAIPHEHAVVSWAFRHACWLLNRFAVSSSTGRTPQEVIHGYPYSGKLVPFGTVVMAKRLKIKKKGDRIWNAGIFLGKTEQDTWIVAQPDGIHITRSVRPLPEQYDSKRTSNIEVHTWNLNTPLLGARVLPEKKQRQRPQLSILPPVAEEEREQLENDEAASDPPSSEDSSEEQQQALEDREEQSEASSMSVTRDRKRRAEVDDETLLEELRAVEPLTASAEALSAPAEPRAEASKHSLEPEEPSSPSKLRKQVNRAEETDGYLNMPHDDEVYEADDEFVYESEEEEEETESEPTEVSTKVPVEFFDEEKGPPNVDPAFLQKLDDEATVKEIKRLTKMGVISLVSTDPQEVTENVPLVDSEQELHKWLTTKLVKDWRFREATGFEAEEVKEGTTKPKQIQRCWQRRITKLVPMLALANHWAIYSVDVKVNATHPVFGQTFVMVFWWKRSLSVVLQFQHFTVFYDKEKWNLKKKVNLQIEGPLLNEEDYEKGFSEETVKFLKRKYTYEQHELRVHSDSKYVKKLVEILKLEKKKAKNSPCTPASQEPDVSQELDEEHSRTYRSCVGILLYVAHDRPDIQFAVRSLSTAMTKPTERKRKELEHLALYLKGTSDYAVTYHRKSVSCAMFYLDGAYFYSYSRTQKSIALSSAEAEYMENEYYSKHTQTVPHAAESQTAKEQEESSTYRFGYFGYKQQYVKASLLYTQLVNYDVDSFDEAKKEVTERAEKLKKEEENLEKEKEQFGNQKTEFEETVKRFLKKQKEVKEKEDKVTEREEKLEKDQETVQQQAKVLSEKETALEEAEENERTAGYDQEREEYAKKYVDDAKKDLERELKVLKQEEKVRNQKLDDLQYDYKSLKDDYQYFKGYSQEVDALLLAAKDKIVKYKKKVKSLKETLGATLSGSEGEEETEEPYKSKAEEEKEKKEAQAKEEEKKKGKRPKQVETEDQEEKPSSNQGDETTVDPNDIAEFTQLGYVWEFNKKTQEYRAKCEDKKGAARIKNAPVKGRMLWNKVTECYRKHNVWFTDGKELDKFLETKENEKIEEEVQRRIHAKGKHDNQGTKGKGPSWDDGQNDGWYYNEQWNNENWSTTDDGSNWYENANPHNKGYWQTPEEWAQQNQWDQWTPKGKGKGKKSKNWAQTQ